MKSNENNQQKPRKKSQKQAANKKRPASKQNDKKYTEIKILNNDGTIKRTTKVPKSGLTLGQYKELRKKDPSSLTTQEKKQLEDTRKQLRKMTESLTSQYDFNSIASRALGIYNSKPFQKTIASAMTINTSPMLKIASDMQKFSPAMQSSINSALGIQASIAPAIEAIRKSSVFTQNQFTALAAIQKTLNTITPTANIIVATKAIQDAFQAPLIAKTMFADFHTAHERILRSLRFDIGSLTASIEFSKLDTVDIALEEVSTDDDSLRASATATQTSNAGNITFVDNASMVLAFNDLRQEVQDLKQQLLTPDKQQGQQLIAPSTVHFKRSTTTIQIGNFRVRSTLSSKQTQFARTIIGSQEDAGKRWDIDDLIFEVFGERIDNNELNWINKIRNYIWQFNQKVMVASGGTMPDYLVLDGIEVFVNPDYL